MDVSIVACIADYVTFKLIKIGVVYSAHTDQYSMNVMRCSVLVANRMNIIILSKLNEFSNNVCHRLDQRTFSTADLLAAQPGLQPFTFNLFQSLWDNTVHTAYMEALGTAL